MNPSLSRAIGVVLFGLATSLGVAAPTAAQPTGSDPVADTAQVVLQAADVTPDGQLAFASQGLQAGEPTAVTVEDDRGDVQATLDPVTVGANGQTPLTSVRVPDGLALGSHILHVAGLTSGRSGRAAFELAWQPPVVRLDGYTGKPTQTVGFTGTGFVPGEQVDVYLGDQASTALTTVTADGRGEIAGSGLSVPFITAGDYRLTFVGRASHIPASIGFNVQGFYPWVVLDNYYVDTQTGVSASGSDFVPGESVRVYLNTSASQPVADVTADAKGSFALRNLSLPGLTGDNRLIFVGDQSQTEVSASFAAATPAPPTP
jgi:hypothetical protein